MKLLYNNERLHRKVTKIMLKSILSSALLAAMLLGASSCKGGGASNPSDADNDSPASVEYSFENCSVIHGASANAKVVKYAQHVKTQLRASAMLDIALETDDKDATDKEILIGDTNRPESISAKAKLPSNTNHAYRIELSGSKFVIVATDDEALETAVQCFLYDVVSKIRSSSVTISSDYCYADSYGSSALLFSNGAQIKTQLVSTIYGPTSTQDVTNLSYGRIIELTHNGENNGVLLATSESLDVSKYLIHQSTDNGQTWEIVGEVTAQMKNMIANWQPMLFELPCRVGDMKEGTILLAGCVRNSDTTKTNMVIYKSTDLGEKWKIVSTVDSADGFSTTGGLSKGLWEPFLLCDDNGSSGASTLMKRKRRSTARSSSAAIPPTVSTGVRLRTWLHPMTEIFVPV